LTGPRYECGEDFDVARETVRGVETGGGDGVQPRTVGVDAETSSHRAGGIGESSRGCLHVRVNEHTCSKSFTGDGFVAMEGEVRDHLHASATERGRKGFDHTHDAGIGA